MNTDETRKAKRYSWLSSKNCNQLYVSKDEHHASDVTARKWIEIICPEDFKNVPEGELERMKQTDAIWEVKFHPYTPIGFQVFYAATLDSAIDAAMEAEGK